MRENERIFDESRLGVPPDPTLRVRVNMIRYPTEPSELTFLEFWNVVHRAIIDRLHVPFPIYGAETPKRCVEQWVWDAVMKPIFDCHAILGSIDAEVEGLDQTQWLTQRFMADDVVLSIGKMHQRRRKGSNPVPIARDSWKADSDDD